MLELPTVLIPPTKQFSTELIVALPVVWTACVSLELTWTTHFGAVILIEALPVSCSAPRALLLSAITQ